MDDYNRCSCSCGDDHVVKSTFPLVQQLFNTNACLFHLTELDLSSNNLCQVPEFIGNLVNVIKFDLSSNELVTLPLAFSKFQRLSNLNLSHNKFAQLPQSLIDGMCSIASLDLSHNQLKDIRQKPYCVQQLLTLNISNNLGLTSFPQWLWSVECNSLESLDISFTNCLDCIEIDPYLYMYGISKSLKCLNISNTGLKIQTCVSKLEFVKHFKNLQTLVLDSKDNILCNSLGKIPSIFNNRFKSIVYLSISNANLCNIEKHVFFSLPNLWYLNLSYNCLSMLIHDSFDELNNLEVLDISNNQITVIPECFKHMKKLKKLVLNNNSVQVFPKILEDLLNLEYLDLYANDLVECPSWNSNIKSLDLEQNVFSTDCSLEQNLKENYSNLLTNLRLSLNECRITGPLCIEEYNDIEPNNISKSSSEWSLYSVQEDDHSEYLNERKLEDASLKSDECWDNDSYENTTILFDPKDFELKLINKMKLEKPLTLAEKYEEKKNLKNVLYYFDEHYFCPSDEFPKLLPVKK